MIKNTANQKWRVFAYDRTTGAAKTGDAANISATINKDYAGEVATNDAAPTEVAHGFYDFDLTQAETNAYHLSLDPISGTANIDVVGCPVTQDTIVAVQTGDAYAVVAHTDYGNAKLVRSTTPANALSVDANGKVAVPDTQKVDVDTVKTRAVTCGAAVTVGPFVGNATAALGVDADGKVAVPATQHVIVDSGTVTTLTNLPAVTTDWLTADGIKTDAVTKIQSGLAKTGDEMDLVDAPNATGVAAIVDAVWDEVLFGAHEVGSSSGALLYSAAGDAASALAEIQGVGGIVAHADYGNAKLVRSATPANALSVDANGKVSCAAADSAKTAAEAVDTLTKAGGDGDLAAILADTTVLVGDVGLLEKWVINKTVLDANAGTIVLYDDDSTTPLKTWLVTETETVQTRNKAT